MPTTRARRRKRTKMKRDGTAQRSRLRGGKAGRASLRSTSPASWKVVTWPTKTMRSVLPTCLKDSRCVLVTVFDDSGVDTRLLNSQLLFFYLMVFVWLSVVLISFSVSQLRSIPVKPAEDDELEEEAEWIFRHGFSTLTISMQVRPLTKHTQEKPTQNCQKCYLIRFPFCGMYHSVDPEKNNLCFLCYLNRRAQITSTGGQPQTSAGKAPAPLQRLKRPSTSWGINSLR